MNIKTTHEQLKIPCQGIYFFAGFAVFLLATLANRLAFLAAALPLGNGSRGLVI